MKYENIIKTLHPIEIKILISSDIKKEINVDYLIKSTGMNEGQVRRGLDWLLSKKLIKETSRNKIRKFTITDKGREFTNKKLIEKAIIEYLINNENVQIKDLMEKLSYESRDIGSTVGNMKKESEIVQQGGFIVIGQIKNSDYYDGIERILKRFENKDTLYENELSDKDVRYLDKSEKIQLHKNFFKIRDTEIVNYALTDNGREIREILIKENITGEEISQITPEILKEKKWKNKKFRRYDLSIPAPHTVVGRKHPYREFLNFLKNKFVALGFKEMRGSLVETEFWNMDSLYMPQFHPARDIHDVYFIKEPHYAQRIEEPYFTNVAKVHKNGGNTGSKGWGYEFNKEKAKQLILRSQGTVLSARTLASNPTIPGKYFAIARCFRYDKVDATHLADFFQVEGIVISNDVNFKTLLGLLTLFAKEIARADDIKFVPAYFPFTEPSVELHIKHPQLGWYELGGAGIFRPEVTIPLGVDVPVLAWGLGVDRMAMMALNINDIRELFSRDLQFIRDSRMVL